MRLAAAALAATIALPLAADPVEEVRQAETAFAKAFADRDQARFFALVADDATFMSAGRTLHGKKSVVEVWSNFFKDRVAPFSWGPERVVVSGDGKLGFSTGPIFDIEGKHAGNYFSTWRREANGEWRVVFDGPGSAPAFLPEAAPRVEEGFVTADDGVKLHFRKIGSAPQTLIVPLGLVLYDHVRQLSDIATVITYDMRNRGRSERVENVNTLTIQQDVRDLEAVRKHFKVEKFVPVGYSYLGMMVAMYAMEHPDRVSRIVQLGPVQMRFDTQFPEHLTEPRSSIGAPADLVARYQELRGKKDVEQKDLCAVQAAVSAYVLVGNPAHHARVTSRCDLPNEWPANFARQLETHWGSVKKLELTDADLKKVAMPVLTIHGTRDRNAPYGAGREWALKLPNARLVTVPGAAHAAFVEDPVTVWGSVRQFLRGEWPLGAEKVTKLDPRS
jgi:pimeloyl-ACP methyl ester carboxylesterase/ketosteroid isomerase-like protein